MKYCKYCGAEIPDYAGFCMKCGKQCEPDTAPGVGQNAGNGSTYQNQQGGYGGSPYQGYGSPYQSQGSYSGMAIASLVLGIISMFINPWTILGILSVIFGVVGMSQTASEGKRGKGMAIAGLILGCIAIVYFIWQLVAASSLLGGYYYYM